VPRTDSPRRAGDPPVLIASAERAGRVLGWNRQFETLSEMIETAWEWRLRFPEGYPE
jgi:UDP-glucose 4-epimerase